MISNLNPLQSIAENEKRPDEEEVEDEKWNVPRDGPGLQRKLKNRHIQMIAIGTWQTFFRLDIFPTFLPLYIYTQVESLGPVCRSYYTSVILKHPFTLQLVRAGLFLRTAQTLAQGGPGGLFFGYATFSTVCVCGAFN